MPTRNRAQAAKDSRNYRARHRAEIALRARARRQADPARRALHVRNYRARKRARQQWRDYYRRNADAINFKRKLADCGIDPKMIQQQEYA